MNIQLREPYINPCPVETKNLLGSIFVVTLYYERETVVEVIKKIGLVFYIDISDIIYLLLEDKSIRTYKSNSSDLKFIVKFQDYNYIFSTSENLSQDFNNGKFEYYFKTGKEFAK